MWLYSIRKILLFLLLLLFRSSIWTVLANTFNSFCLSRVATSSLSLFCHQNPYHYYHPHEFIKMEIDPSSPTGPYNSKTSYENMAQTLLQQIRFAEKAVEERQRELQWPEGQGEGSNDATPTESCMRCKSVLDGNLKNALAFRDSMRSMLQQLIDENRERHGDLGIMILDQ